MTNTELREKLVGLLMQCDMDSDIDNDGVICDGCGRRPLSEACVAIADHLIANGVTFGKDTAVPTNWISVKERLPEESGTHIVVALNGHAKEVTFVKWQKMNKMWNLIGARSYWKVTHWLPMPEPPKEVEE